MRFRRRVVPLLLLVALVSSCAAGPNIAEPAPGTDAAGFWLGLWQGLISPITFVISLFNQNVNIYEVVNNGGWYNFGFMIGVSIVFSGGPVGAATRNRSRASN